MKLDKYLRTKYGIFIGKKNDVGALEVNAPYKIFDRDIVAQADTLEELFDEIVLIVNGNERNVVYLQEAYDRIVEYHELGNYEPRLIGRIKAGLDKKAVAEWKENEQGLYDWILL